MGCLFDAFSIFPVFVPVPDGFFHLEQAVLLRQALDDVPFAWHIGRQLVFKRRLIGEKPHGIIDG